MNPNKQRFLNALKTIKLTHQQYKQCVMGINPHFDSTFRLNMFSYFIPLATYVGLNRRQDDPKLWFKDGNKYGLRSLTETVEPQGEEENVKTTT